MQRLPRASWPAIERRDDRMGQLLAPQLIRSGAGEWWVDAWPAPRASFLVVGGNVALQGSWTQAEAAFLAERLAERLRTWERVFVEMPSELEATVLPRLAPLQSWPLHVFQRAHTPMRRMEETETLRRLDATHSSALAGMSPDLHWIGDPWGGLEALAASGRAWGAWQDGALVSVAAAGLVGETHEDVFVVTQPGYRGRGLSPRCAEAVVADAMASGKTATWTTWPANASSQRVAEKLGFRKVRDLRAWIAGRPL